MYYPTCQIHNKHTAVASTAPAAAAHMKMREIRSLNFSSQRFSFTLFLYVFFLARVVVCFQQHKMPKRNFQDEQMRDKAKESQRHNQNPLQWHFSCACLLNIFHCFVCFKFICGFVSFARLFFVFTFCWNTHASYTFSIHLIKISQNEKCDKVFGFPDNIVYCSVATIHV